jgi:hypothetical protein
MNLKISKIKVIFLSAILLITASFIPSSASDVNNSTDMEFNKSLIEIEDIKIDKFSIFETDDDLKPFLLDRFYPSELFSPITNRNDNDDAGYKRDSGDEISRSFSIYPGEMIDNWPGRGRTGKLSSDDDEDWFFFSVCEGQDITIIMIPPSGFDFDIGLWDENEVERGTSTNSGSIQESITYTADYTGRWYLRIHYISGTDEGQYSFNVTLSGQNDANTGDDAGDDFASATSINTGSYEGYLDMNDEEDWYKFNVNSGQGIHFTLEMKKIAYLSDFDIYLYNPNEELVHSETYYYDDELFYKSNLSGQWRVRIKIFPGYTDIPKPTDWDYYTYGSGPYNINLALEGSVPNPPGPIPQPDITPIAQTFKIQNDFQSNEDEYSYLASIPACNYLEEDNRFLSPIVYSKDNTETNWYGTVDDTTVYLYEDWEEYLSYHNKSSIEYNVSSDPVQAASDIATNFWETSDLTVVTVEGSEYEDDVIQVLQKTKTLKRKIKIETIPSTSPEFVEFKNYYVYPMILLPKWGAVNIAIKGDNEEPSLLEIFPLYMPMGEDWWPEHVDEKDDLYHPISTMGLWAAAVGSVLQSWDLKITRFGCDRYRIKINDPDSVLSVKVTTSTPSDLLVFLVDPNGHLKAPDIPGWNGGPINPIHEMNGIDNPSYPPDCNDWSAWKPENHTEFSAEVLHPDAGWWTAIVVPRYPEGSKYIDYSINGQLRKINTNRVDAVISAANAAVIASMEHAPLLYVKEDSIPIETQNAIDKLGVKNVIIVDRGEMITQSVIDDLPLSVANLNSMQDIIDYIKSYDSSENYITITSIKSGKGFFAPAAMLAAYHGSPVLRIGDMPENPAGLANRIDTWRLWAGDYYHGCREPSHLPVHDEPITQPGFFELFFKVLKWYQGKSTDLPPFGLDAKRYWNEEMHDAVYNYINNFGLDKEGKEVYAIVAPRKDIRLELHSVLIGNNSYAGQIPGETPSYTNDVVIRNILYPALIFANENRDITTSMLMNFPDGGTWRTNDGNNHNVYSSRLLKKIFMSHGRCFDGHCLWDAHLERMNNGASLMYYSGHGIGGSGISAQFNQTDYCNYPDQIWPDAWRGYMFDNWKTARDNGRRWYNPEPPNLYDFIHYKWHDQLFKNLKSNAIFYNTQSTGQHFGPMIYLDHGAVIWYGNAGGGLCPQSNLLDDCMFEDSLINGLSIGEAYSKYAWLHQRDFTTGDINSMYGPSTLYAEDGITTVHCIYGDPNLVIYSPEWISPEPIATSLAMN